MLTLIRKYYNIIYNLGPLYFNGSIVIRNNNVDLIYGAIAKEKETIGLLIKLNPYYKTYNSNYEQDIIKLLDNLKQELRNMGYVVE